MLPSSFRSDVNLVTKEEPKKEESKYKHIKSLLDELFT